MVARNLVPSWPVTSSRNAALLPGGVLLFTLAAREKTKLRRSVAFNSGQCHVVFCNIKGVACNFGSPPPQVRDTALVPEVCHFQYKSYRQLA